MSNFCIECAISLLQQLSEIRNIALTRSETFTRKDVFAIQLYARVCFNLYNCYAEISANQIRCAAVV